MPLITCPDCGREHSDRAVACPQCARPNRSTYDAEFWEPKHYVPEAAPRRGRWGYWAIGFVAVIGISQALSSPPPPESPDEARGRRLVGMVTTARYRCRDVTRNSLVAPSGADFVSAEAGFLRREDRSTDSTRAVVRGVVDAQNRFGAT